MHEEFDQLERRKREMKKDYPKLAKDILENVGGTENVTFVMNCATRLRFQLKDMDKANTEAIKAMKGVIDVIIQNGQYQVCIGPDVIDVFNEVNKIGNFTATAQEENKKDEKLIDRFFGVVSGIFTPIVPILMAAGMVGALLTVLNLVGILPQTSSTYYVWNLIKEAGFYFLPIYVAYTASKKLGANPYLSMLLAGVLVHPNLNNFDSLGVKQLTFLGIGIKNVSYSQTILPIILTVWLESYVEKFFTKILPQVVRAFGVPMLSTMVTVPIMLIVIGPAGSVVADYLSGFVLWLGANFGFVAVGILAALTPIMIATGTHSFAFPVIVSTLAMNGFEALIVPAMLAENLAMAGASFAVGFKSKDKDLKAEANAATLSACLGISEPSMYGINLPRKTPFYAAIIGSGIGGLVAGLFGIRFYAIASASFVGLPATIGDGSMMGVVYSLIVIAISFVSAFIFTNILGVKEQEKVETKEDKTVLNTEVYAPIEGKVIELADVADKTFASGAMGKGCAIEPSKGEVVAPFDGSVEMVFNTKHAIGLKSNEGAEVLIHIGMDTVNLQGKHFTVLKQAGDSIKKGDVLVQFDMDAIKKDGYSCITPIVITNTNDYVDVLTEKEGSIQKGENLLKLV